MPYYTPNIALFLLDVKGRWLVENRMRYDQSHSGIGEGYVYYKDALSQILNHLVQTHYYTISLIQYPHDVLFKIPTDQHPRVFHCNTLNEWVICNIISNPIEYSTQCTPIVCGTFAVV